MGLAPAALRLEQADQPQVGRLVVLVELEHPQVTALRVRPAVGQRHQHGPQHGPRLAAQRLGPVVEPVLLEEVARVEVPGRGQLRVGLRLAQAVRGQPPGRRRQEGLDIDPHVG